MTYQVGDKVKALAFTDSSGKFHAEVNGLTVESIQIAGGQNGVAVYQRLNCTKLPGEDVIQVEAAARFFEKVGA